MMILTMKGFGIILFSLLVSLVFAVEPKDLSPNYRYYSEAEYLMNNNLVPAYVDGTFQPNAELTLPQVAIVMMEFLDMGPSYNSVVPHMAQINNSFKVFPYFQTLVESGYISTENPLFVPATVVEATDLLQQFFPTSDFATDLPPLDPLSRQNFIILLQKTGILMNEMDQYAENVQKKRKEYIGSAVSDFILGNTNALEKIELTSYQAKNQNFAEMFWELALGKDRDYQKFNEDLSSEEMNILEKRLNQAVLDFREGKYWLTIEKCNIILKEDPKHIGSLMLKGSTYYMLRDYTRAKKYWKKVLYYEPNNQEVAYFLKILP